MCPCHVNASSRYNSHDLYLTMILHPLNIMLLPVHTVNLYEYAYFVIIHLFNDVMMYICPVVEIKVVTTYYILNR